MLKDLLENYNLEKLSRKELLGLLGKPDFSEGNTIYYRIVENYANDIDPVRVETLEIGLRNDETVESVTVLKK